MIGRALFSEEEAEQLQEPRHSDNAPLGPRGLVHRRQENVANAIVGQMLSDGVVRGGSSLKIRFGDAATRATIDLDATRAPSPIQRDKCGRMPLMLR